MSSGAACFEPAQSLLYIVGDWSRRTGYLSMAGTLLQLQVCYLVETIQWVVWTWSESNCCSSCCLAEAFFLSFWHGFKMYYTIFVFVSMPGSIQLAASVLPFNSIPKYLFILFIQNRIKCCRNPNLGHSSPVVVSLARNLKRRLTEDRCCVTVSWRSC